jgi:CBS domain-containing protein
LLREESLFLARVREVYRKDTFTCKTNITAANVALLMKEMKVSGVIVSNNDLPIGVVTDRDLRDKVLALGLDPTKVFVSSILNEPLISIKEDDFLSEAVYKMLENNIHRLAVVDDGGGLLGVITDTDIIKFQTDTALYFMRDLEAARNMDDVKTINNKMTDYIGKLFKAEIKPKDLVRLISYLNDLIIVKVIKLIVERDFLKLPGKFAFLVLGSEGRMEQTLKTDQDNAIVYSDELDKEELDLLEAFSVKLIESLVDIGFPSCPGGIMAKNSIWRKSLSDWGDTVKNWVSVPTPDNILNYSMFSDLRTVYGDLDLEKALKQRVVNVISKNPVFLAHMANNILRFKPPLNFLGGFKVEKKGEHTGKLDIKMTGIFPLTEGIKVLALEAGIMEGGTVDKISKLLGRGVVPDDELHEVEASLDFFIYLRLKSQIEQASKGLEPTNFIDPLKLNEVERERLKVGFSMVKAFQSFLADKYKVSFLAG